MCGLPRHCVDSPRTLTIGRDVYQRLDSADFCLGDLSANQLAMCWHGPDTFDLPYNVHCECCSCIAFGNDIDSSYGL